MTAASEQTSTAINANDGEAVTERSEDTLRRLAGYLLAVEELHAERRRDIDGYTLRWCRECNQNWPCPTIRAANGWELADG